MDRETERAIEWDCAQLLTRFFNEFDRFNYAAMADLFAPDGIWHRQGKALQGTSAIIAALEPRSRTQSVRHVVTNIEVTASSETEAVFTLYVTAYMHDSGDKTVPAKVRAPYLMLVVPGTLAKWGEDWKIATMSMNREFEFE